MLKDFTRVAAMPQEVIEKYKDQIPAELVQIWEEDGLGTFLDGYLKVINPDEYLELFRRPISEGIFPFPFLRQLLGILLLGRRTNFWGLLNIKMVHLIFF